MSVLFVRLELDWLDNPKLIRAGMVGRGIHAAAMVLSKRLETDGWFDRLLLVREGATEEQIDRLIELELLEVDGDRVRPWEWLDRNPSQAAIDASRASKSEAGKRGNHRRHKHGGDYESCAICHPPEKNPTSSQGAKGVRGGAVAPARNVSPETEAETETSPTDSSNYSDRGPLEHDRPAVDEQTFRAAVAAVARIEAGTRSSDGGYVAGIRTEILTGDDPERRDRVRRLLLEHRTPEAVAAAWPSSSAPAGYPTVDQAAQERPRLPEWTPPAVEVADPSVARAALARARGREAVPS